MIKVQATQSLGTLRNFWNHIHFHPTDAIEDAWGQAILDEVAKDGVAETVRMYAMLEDIVTMDEDGTLQYDFTENDVRMDYIISRGFKIFLSYNYMPPCITEDPMLLEHANKKSTRYKGKRISAARLRDDALWEEICYRYTEHIVERYGLDTVKNWYLQCYNEPDHANYFMKELGPLPQNLACRLAEYLRLYRGFARGVSRVSTELYVGGPASAGDIPFLEGFLAAVKEEGLKLDFFTGHTYGTGPDLLNRGERPFAVKNTLNKVIEYQNALDRYFPDVEIVIDEWGAAYSGFYDREECPQLLFREGSEYAAYYLKTIVAYLEAGVRVSRQMICLSGQHDLPCDFSGCRNFMGLNLIKKPIYNAYALAAGLGSTRLLAESDVKDLTALATAREDGALCLMLAYAAEHFDKELPTVTDTLTVDGVGGKYRVVVHCIDKEHTNPYQYALSHGWGDLFDSAQIEELRRVGTLVPLADYEAEANGKLEIPLRFTTNALLRVELLPLP
ncbi:MAG: hypothetical protein E7643_00340 [Ruminococcaceae bacterium]|nr:hypothetical protein [Oscillospiraceae bacterium]